MYYDCLMFRTKEKVCHVLTGGQKLSINFGKTGKQIVLGVISLRGSL